MSVSHPGLSMSSLLILVLALSSAPLLAREVVLLGVFPDRALVDIDGQRRVLIAGETAHQGVRLLSTSTLKRSAWLEVDGQRRELALLRETPPTVPDAMPVEVRIHPDASGALTVSGNIEGHAVRFRVDPDAALTVLSGSDADRIGLDAGRGQLTTVQMPAGRVFGHRVTLPSVQVGGITIHQVEAVIVQGDLPRLPVLGKGFLRRIEMREEGGALLLRGPRS